MAKRKIDALGNFRGESGFANDPERLKRLKGQVKNLCLKFGTRRYFSPRACDARGERSGVGPDVLITEAPVRGGVGNPRGLTRPVVCPGSNSLPRVDSITYCITYCITCITYVSTPGLT